MKDYLAGMKWVLNALAVAIVLSACAQLGLLQPQTPAQKVAAGYVTADAINQSATQLLNERKISSDDAQHVLNSTRAARQGLDIARKLEKVDPKGATAKLEAQMVILQALQKYLAEKEKR